MDEQVKTHKATLFWSITGILAVGLSVAAGVLFGQTALWGATGAAAVLYIGSLGIWFSHRDSTKKVNGDDGGLQSSSLPTPSNVPASPKTLHTRRNSMEVGSPEFSNLIHDLAGRIDDPTDIIDIARRAGISMSNLRSGGSQSPLNLWTAVLARAIRDGKVERLVAEAS